MGFLPGRELRLRRRGAVGAQLVRLLLAEPLPAETLLNVNCPAGEPAGDRGHPARQAPLQRRAEAGRRGRRRPPPLPDLRLRALFEDEPGTDLAAVARGRISITPGALRPDRPRGPDAAARVGPRADARRHAGGRRERHGERARIRRSARRSSGARSPTTTTATTSSTTPRSATTTTTRCSTSCAQIEEETPRASTPDSPTQRVGRRGRWTSSSRSATREPMLSLANARSAEEFRAWETRLHNRLRQLDIEPGELRFVSEPKIDGLAISLTYEDGVFTRGATRGDGIDGRGRHPEPAHDQGDPDCGSTTLRA